MALCKPASWLSPDPESASTWILDFPASRIMRNKRMLCCLKPTSPFFFPLVLSLSRDVILVATITPEMGLAKEKRPAVSSGQRGPWSQVLKVHAQKRPRGGARCTGCPGWGTQARPGRRPGINGPWGLQDPPPPGRWALEAPASGLKGSSLGPGSLAHLYEGSAAATAWGPVQSSQPGARSAPGRSRAALSSSRSVGTRLPPGG